MELVIHLHYPTICQYHSFIYTRFQSHLIQIILKKIRYCLVGIGVMALGIIYWAVWRVVLPKIFGYELVPNKVVLDDGTVVNVVRSLCYHSSFDLWLIIYLFF